jgi:outer membrane protein assembly factor BamB
MREVIYAGIHGTVLALDKSSGNELWTTKLKGSEFVNLTLDGDQLIATTAGEVFCLDALSGKLRWRNKLPGLGQGIISIVTALSPAANITPAGELQRKSAGDAAVVTSVVMSSAISS